VKVIGQGPVVQRNVVTILALNYMYLGVKSTGLVAEGFNAKIN
jgi:hypothetical protein